MAKQKSTGKAVVKWDEKFAKLAKTSIKGMNLPTAKFISLQGGRMSYGGAQLPGDEIEAVIIAAVHENQFYDPNEPYNREEVQPPICYAFGLERDEDGNVVLTEEGHPIALEKDQMAPPDSVPEKQNDVCVSCRWKEWASASTGQGKACRDVLRLALIASSDLENLSTAEIVYMKVPTMSVKNWLFYANKKINDGLKRPYWSVTTTIKVEPDPKSLFRVTFELGDQIEDSDLFEPLEELWIRTMEGIDFPYAAREKKQPVAAKAKGFKSTKAAPPAKFARRK